MSKVGPLANLGAVVAVLRACRQLETSWTVFDGSLGMPFCGQQGKAAGELETEIGIKGGVEREVGNENESGVKNQRITHIRVGHSSLGEDDQELEGLTRCLRSAMMRLEKIRRPRYMRGGGGCDVGGAVKSVYAY